MMIYKPNFERAYIMANNILVSSNVLEEFPVNKIQVKMPRWMEVLPFDNALIEEIVNEIKLGTDGLSKIGEFKLNKTLFEDSENFEPIVQNTDVVDTC